MKSFLGEECRRTSCMECGHYYTCPTVMQVIQESAEKKENPIYLSYHQMDKECVNGCHSFYLKSDCEDCLCPFVNGGATGRTDSGVVYPLSWEHGIGCHHSLDGCNRCMNPAIEGDCAGSPTN